MALCGGAAHAQMMPSNPKKELVFQLHARFFSDETKPASPLDPQVFVRHPGAPAGFGPQNIRHVAGFLPAPLNPASPSPVYNALGHALGFDLSLWFAATGMASLRPEGQSLRVTCRFERLIPRGVYSLFENHFDQKPVGFTPLDGSGTANHFTADDHGGAMLSVLAPKTLNMSNAVLLVYHSDGKAHGMSRGMPGVSAHHQLIAPYAAMNGPM